MSSAPRTATTRRFLDRDPATHQAEESSWDIGEFIRGGNVVAGKYRIERVLGMGGMGVVLAAEHLDLRRRVALKVLLPGVYEAPEAASRMLREARAAAQIRSEHVVRVM